MRKAIAYATAIVWLSGCAPAALVPTEAAAGLVQSVGSTASSLFATEASTRLTGANLQLTQAQARLALTKAEGSALEETRLTTERIVTARLLTRMACTYHDPLLETLAQWVAGGGDPDFAFKYALARVTPTVSQVKVIPSQTDLLTGHNQSFGPGSVQRCPQSAAIGLAHKPQQFSPDVAHQPVQQTPKPGPV
jgi:hypothetical protein